jgi:hypothetical protein
MISHDSYFGTTDKVGGFKDLSIFRMDIYRHQICLALVFMKTRAPITLLYGKNIAIENYLV